MLLSRCISREAQRAIPVYLLPSKAARPGHEANSSGFVTFNKATPILCRLLGCCSSVTYWTCHSSYFLWLFKH